MAVKNVFDFSSYKEFLIYVEESRNSFQRGFRTKLAKFIGCQNGYISHVLNGDAHFSLEQSFRIVVFLALKEKEKKCFLTLVEYNRAGTKELRQHFEQELQTLKAEYFNIKERVGDSLTLNEMQQVHYYSHWSYIAIHMLVGLPGYTNAKALSQALMLPEETVDNVLLFLIESQIIKEVNGVLKPGITQVHLNRESPLIRQHHTNLRMASIQSLVSQDTSDIHYSTLSTLSKADAEKLKSDMTKLIEHYVQTVKPSKEEVMFGFNLDFYSVVKK